MSPNAEDIGHYQHTVHYESLPIFGRLISEKVVTLKELQEYYIYDECLVMDDIIMTDYYNKRTIEMSMKRYAEARV